MNIAAKMDSTSFSRDVETLHPEDLRFCTTSIQQSVSNFAPNSQVDSLFNENKALRKQVELLRKNQSLRSVSIISTLLNWIDDNDQPACIAFSSGKSASLDVDENTTDSGLERSQRRVKTSLEHTLHDLLAEVSQESNLISELSRDGGSSGFEPSGDDSSSQNIITQLNNSNRNTTSVTTPSPHVVAKALNSGIPTATEDVLQAKFAPRVRRYSVTSHDLKETEVVSMAPNSSSDHKDESKPFNFTITERGIDSDAPRPHGYTWTPKKRTDSASVPKQFPSGLPLLPQAGIGAPLATSTPTGRKFSKGLEDRRIASKECIVPVPNGEKEKRKIEIAYHMPVAESKQRPVPFSNDDSTGYGSGYTSTSGRSSGSPKTRFPVGGYPNPNMRPEAGRSAYPSPSVPDGMYAVTPSGSKDKVSSSHDESKLPTEEITARQMIQPRRSSLMRTADGVLVYDTSPEALFYPENTVRMDRNKQPEEISDRQKIQTRRSSLMRTPDGVLVYENSPEAEQYSMTPKTPQAVRDAHITPEMRRAFPNSTFAPQSDYQKKTGGESNRSMAAGSQRNKPPYSPEIGRATSNQNVFTDQHLKDNDTPIQMQKRAENLNGTETDMEKNSTGFHNPSTNDEHDTARGNHTVDVIPAYLLEQSPRKLVNDGVGSNNSDIVFQDKPLSRLHDEERLETLKLSRSADDLNDGQEKSQITTGTKKKAYVWKQDSNGNWYNAAAQVPESHSQRPKATASGHHMSDIELENWSTEQALRKADFEIAVSHLRSPKRIIGEIAFQLDRRILNFVFNKDGSNDKKRFYSYTIGNIEKKMQRESINQMTGDFNREHYNELRSRYEYLISNMGALGYDISYHGDVAADLVNKYGLLPLPPKKEDTRHFKAENRYLFEELLVRITPEEESRDAVVLLNCLAWLSHIFDKPMVAW